MQDAGVDDLPSMSPWRTVTRWLLVLCVGVFVLDMILSTAGVYRTLSQSDGTPIITRGADGVAKRIAYPLLASYGYFSIDTAIVGKQVWRFFTYQFCHANITHILVNMMALLLAGPIVEERLGRAKYLGFYLVCGAAGPVGHMLLSHFGVLSMNHFTPLVGASASIYGVMVASARIAPNEMVMLALPPIDVKLKTLVLVLVGLSAVAVLWHWDNAGGHAAHLGGAFAGWWLARRMVDRH